VNEYSSEQLWYISDVRHRDESNRQIPMKTAETAFETQVGAREAEAGDATLVSGCGLLIFRLARASAWRLGRSLRESGLRWAEFAVLHHLEAQGPASQRDLAMALRIQPSNLVALLDQLERRELLDRRPDPADRRRHRVELTPAGRQIVERAREATKRAESDLLGPLSASERREFRGLLVRLTAHTCDRGGTRRTGGC
jgi:MarR family transcriptional regulator, lower aerobic nicotinate degradation pathway regulator